MSQLTGVSWLLALAPLEQWTAVAAFLAALLSVCGLVAHFGWKITRQAIRLLDAIADNTRAVDALTRRVDTLEQRRRPTGVRRGM